MRTYGRNYGRIKVLTQIDNFEGRHVGIEHMKIYEITYQNHHLRKKEKEVQ